MLMSVGNESTVSCIECQHTCSTTGVKRTSCGDVKQGEFFTDCDIYHIGRTMRKSLREMNWQQYAEYMSSARINLNIRQVYPLV